MPTYQYHCNVCGKDFEIFQQITADPISKCPYCGKRGLQRLIGAGAGVIFKGSGFYQTDYRSESYKKGAQEEKSSRDSSNVEKSSQDKADNK